jgi:hypothetical protein
VIVDDVTGTPTDRDLVIEKCQHPEMVALIRSCLQGLEYDLYSGCPDLVLTADETEVYARRCPKTCFLGIPIRGGNYNNGPVSCTARSIRTATEALCRIARG